MLAVKRPNLSSVFQLGAQRQLSLRALRGPGGTAVAATTLRAAVTRTRLLWSRALRTCPVDPECHMRLAMSARTVLHACGSVPNIDARVRALVQLRLVGRTHPRGGRQPDPSSCARLSHSCVPETPAGDTAHRFATHTADVAAARVAQVQSSVGEHADLSLVMWGSTFKKHAACGRFNALTSTRSAHLWRPR